MKFHKIISVIVLGSILSTSLVCTANQQIPVPVPTSSWLPSLSIPKVSFPTIGAFKDAYVTFMAKHTLIGSIVAGSVAIGVFWGYLKCKKWREKQAKNRRRIINSLNQRNSNLTHRVDKCRTVFGFKDRKLLRRYQDFLRNRGDKETRDKLVEACCRSAMFS